MKKEQFKELVNLYIASNDEKSAIMLMLTYILELEKRIEKLEAKDFTRNEPLIGGYDY